MRLPIRKSLLAVCIAVAPPIRAQQFTNNGAGHWYTNAGVDGVTIGNNVANAPAALTVRGGDMLTPNTELIRSITPTGQNGFWCAYRNNIRIGELYTTNPQRGFHLRAPQDNGGGIDDPGILWMENDDQDGIMIRANDQTGNFLPTLNTYPLTNDGFLSVGKRGGFMVPGTVNMPSRARLHVVDSEGDVEEPWRPYFRNGAHFTGNHDMGYVGHRYYHEGEDAWQYEGDHSDLLITVGEDDMTDALRQRIRFTYTTTPVLGATNGAASYNGMEFMQLWPESVTEGFVGIGDFQGAGLNPTQRVDILNGKVRVRQLPTDPVSTSTEFVTVNMSSGVLEHRPIGSLPDNCEWTMNGSSPNHVWTAVGTPNASCPDALEFVGIGTSTPSYKLDVSHARSTSASWGGVRSAYRGGSSGANYGVHSLVTPENGTNMDNAEGVIGDVQSLSTSGNGVKGGVTVTWDGAHIRQAAGVYGSVVATAGVSDYLHGSRGEVGATSTTVTNAYGSSGNVTGNAGSTFAYATGMYGLSQHSGIAAFSYGGSVRSQWTNGSTVGESFGLLAISGPANNVMATVNNSYGVSSAATGGTSGNYSIAGANAGSGSNDWAGHFAGRTYCAGTVFVPSDAHLKTEIVPIAEMEDDPVAKLFQLQPLSYRYRREEFPQMGLPQGLNFGFLAQDVEALFPDMVTDAVQPAEYDSTGAEIHAPVAFKAVSDHGLVALMLEALKRQQSRLDGMEAQLAACCAAGEQRALPASGSSVAGLETDLRIVPNPVADRTELRYIVGEAGRVRLEITDASGRSIHVQDEGQRATGAFVYEWNTTLLAPGTYHCTLFVNDERLVEKAVKLSER